MGHGDRSFFFEPERDDMACYQVIGGETVELSGRPRIDLPGPFGNGQSASPCGLHLGGMTPSLSGDQVATVLPYLSDSAGGIEREPPEKKTAISGRLAATLMDAMIPFHSDPRLTGISDLFKGLNGSHR